MVKTNADTAIDAIPGSSVEPELQSRYAASPQEVRQLDTAGLRAQFLIDSVFERNRIVLVYSHYDRLIIAGAMPVRQSIGLPNPDELKADYFLERREMGILNVGGKGSVTVDGTRYELDRLDCLYVGKGIREVSFESADPNQPAQFYLLSAPAHRPCPTRLMTSAEASPVDLGSRETANERTIFKYIHLDGIESCQLVMGLTVLKPGSVWNTMPAHTHDRRMEAYLYFDVPDNQCIMHFMGQPTETRHLVVTDRQAIISPPWSIHSGCGTSSYSFIWGMAGENQQFTDMDAVAIHALR